MATYHIHHRTIYRYRYPVAVSHHAAHLEPPSFRRQQCRQFNLEINPRPLDLTHRQDYFGNRVHYFSVQEPHGELVVDSNSEVSVQVTEPPLPELTPTCRDVRAFLAHERSEESLFALQFTYPSSHVPRHGGAADLARQFLTDDTPYLQGVLALSAHLHREFTFDPVATDVSTPVDQFLTLRRGVCQDFAHLGLSCLRSLALPARYVSGYLLTHPPEGKERLQGADASHAWISVYIPGFGWVDVDPTNNILCSDEHATVATGRDYGDVSLVRGAVTGGGDHTIGVEVTMTPL